MHDQIKNRFAKTKIIATLGPASASRERLNQMLDAGLDVCRLNFSHGDLDEHQRTLELVRSVAAERDEPICIIGDLCGPKIRLGTLPGGPVELKAGDEVRFVRGDGPCDAGRLTADSPAVSRRLTVSYPRFVDEVAPVRHRTPQTAGRDYTEGAATGVRAVSSRRGCLLP